MLVEAEERAVLCGEAMPCAGKGCSAPGRLSQGWGCGNGSGGVGTVGWMLLAASSLPVCVGPTPAP